MHRKDAYLLPQLDDTLWIVGSKRFSTIDLAIGYWQVEVCTEDYFFLKGLLECNVMLLSLCYGPATCTFQRLMNLVLPGLEWVTYSCLVYMDDVIIFFKSFDKPLRNKEAFFFA